MEKSLELACDGELGVDMATDGVLVAVEIRGIAGEVAGDLVSCQLGRVEGVVDSLAGEWINETGGIADEGDGAAGQGLVEVTERERVTPHVLE